MKRDRFDQLLGDWRWDDIALIALFAGYLVGWMAGYW